MGGRDPHFYTIEDVVVAVLYRGGRHRGWV